MNLSSGASAVLSTKSTNVATVFGCTGFLGRYIVNRFGRLGSQVVVPYRGEEKAINHLKLMGDVGQIVPFRYHIRDEESVEKALAHSNVVVNLVGKHYYTRNFSVRDANVESARTIATAAKKAGVSRFIHISCVGASLDSPSDLLRAKAESEKVVQEIFPSATIIRCTPVFGPEDRLLNKFGYLIRLSPILLLPIRGSSLIQPLYVRDFASAVISALNREESLGKIYELGGPDIFSVREFLEEVIFEMTKSNGTIIELPGPLAELLAWYTEQTRKSIWVRDEIKYFKNDNTVSSKALGMKDLHVVPTSIHQVALNILRSYRKPIRFDAE